MSWATLAILFYLVQGTIVIAALRKHDGPQPIFIIFVAWIIWPLFILVRLINYLMEKEI